MEPLDSLPRAGDAYLHRAARMAVLLALPVLVRTDDKPRFRGPAGSSLRIERSLPAGAAPVRRLAAGRRVESEALPADDGVLAQAPVERDAAADLDGRRPGREPEVEQAPVPGYGRSAPDPISGDPDG